MTVDRADARRLHAIDVAARSGDTAAWIDAVIDRYRGLLRRQVADDELAACRRQVLDRSDTLRAASRSRLGRLWAGQQLDGVFGELLRDVLARAHPDPSEVFQLNEAAKARMLLDALDGNWVQPRRDVAEQLARAEREAMAYAADVQGGTVWDEIRLTSEIALGRSRSRLDELERRYSEAAAGFTGSTPVAALSDVRAQLRPGELVLEFVIPHHPLHPAFGVWALVIGDGDTELVPLVTDPLSGSSGFVGRLTVDDRAPIDASPLGDAIIALRSAVQGENSGQAEATLRQLYSLLFDPLAEAGVSIAGYRQLTIVPHRVLHPVPFAALRDANGIGLGEHAAVNIVPSASVWSRLIARQRPLVRRFIAFANPTFDDPALKPLPGAEREADVAAGGMARAGFSVDVRARAHASEAALVASASGNGIVYFATHGSTPDAGAIDTHGIVLAAADGYDGHVTANEVRLLDLAATWTVVLSVCDSGLYRFGPGDEPLGLMPALLAAGADNVVATLWELDDSVGRRMMTQMMKRIIGEGPAAALQSVAVDEARSGGVPIRDWSAYVAVGSGYPPIVE